jgi:hypothetical protein
MRRLYVRVALRGSCRYARLPVRAAARPDARWATVGGVLGQVFAFDAAVCAAVYDSTVRRAIVHLKFPPLAARGAAVGGAALAGVESA